MTKNLDAWIKAASCSVYPGIYITYLIQTPKGISEQSVYFANWCNMLISPPWLLLQGASEADKICDFVELTAEPQLLPFAPKRDLQSNPAGLRLGQGVNNPNGLQLI